MIFVTVGTQLAFDRLVSAVDTWASTAGGDEVFAQIGPSALQPKRLKYKDFVSPADADELFRSA